jgi:hypothetical protein
MKGRLPRPLARDRVGVEHPPALDAEALDRAQVVDRVHTDELLAGGRWRLAPIEAHPAVAPQLVLDRPQSRGALGMGAGVVVVRGGVVDVESHARGYRTGALPLPPMNPATAHQSDVAVVAARRRLSPARAHWDQRPSRTSS